MATPQNQPLKRILLLLFFASFAVQAQETEKLSVINKKYPHPLMVMLDFDEDGQLTLDEFKMAPKFLRAPDESKFAAFQRFDKNQDKVIQSNELPPYFRMIPNNLRPWTEEKVSDLDLNQDGYVSEEEFYKAPFIGEYSEDRRKQIFTNHDSDKDGKISATDYLIQRKNRLLQQRDINKDGKVEFFEYKQASWALTANEENVKKFFNSRDTNKNGHIDKKDEFPLDSLHKNMKLKP